MITVKFYDTNALLLLKSKAFEDRFAISSVTLEELENIKTNRNKDEAVKFSAREVVRLLDRHTDIYDVVVYNSEIEAYISSRKIEDTPDIKIVACAYHMSLTTNIEFISDDILCKTIARNMFGLDAKSVKIDDKDICYRGYKEISMTDEVMADFYENTQDNIYGLNINEYLIIKDESGNVIDKFKWTDIGYQPLKVPTVRSAHFGVVKPYSGDVYQQLALNSLADNQLTMIKGVAGTGKSYLALGYLFSLLDKKKIDKIVIFANPTPTMNSAKIGFLPGSQLDKLIDSSVGNMLASKLGDKYAIEQLVSQNKLSILPMCDIRGFDTTGLNCGVYITEAQNMDISLMKLALQRIGEDSICVVEGDYNAQVDLGQYSGANNGMRRMSEVFRGYDFYGEVELQNIYRGKIAKIAEEM